MMMSHQKFKGQQPIDHQIADIKQPEKFLEIYASGMPEQRNLSAKTLSKSTKQMLILDFFTKSPKVPTFDVDKEEEKNVEPDAAPLQEQSQQVQKGPLSNNLEGADLQKHGFKKRIKVLSVAEEARDSKGAKYKIFRGVCVFDTPQRFVNILLKGDHQKFAKLVRPGETCSISGYLVLPNGDFLWTEKTRIEKEERTISRAYIKIRKIKDLLSLYRLGCDKSGCTGFVIDNRCCYCNKINPITKYLYDFYIDIMSPANDKNGIVYPLRTRISGEQADKLMIMDAKTFHDSNLNEKGVAAYTSLHTLRPHNTH